jgi:hypothetical protein
MPRNSETPPGLTLKLWMDAMEMTIDDPDATPKERTLAKFAYDLLERSPDSPTIQHFLDRRGSVALERTDR